MNFLQLAENLPDKESCVRFLQQKGILHNPRRCPNLHNMTLSLADRQDRWRCNQRCCRFDSTVRSDTWLAGSKLPYKTIIFFCYCWAHEMTSIAFCERELLMDDNTVVDWNNYLREVCAMTIINNPAIIGGPGLTVEIDESLFSKRKNHRGRMFPQKWVFGGVCRETNECFLFTVDRRDANTLLPIIRDSIRPGSTIISDEWAAYIGINAMGLQYTHLVVNHSRNFVNPINNAHTQKVESTWNAAKAKNRKRWGTHRAMVESYLCEFMWRRRLQGRDPFDVIMQDISAYWPPGF